MPLSPPPPQPVVIGIFGLQSLFVQIVAQTVHHQLLTITHVTPQLIANRCARCFVDQICAVCYQWREVVRRDSGVLARAVIRRLLIWDTTLRYGAPLQALPTVDLHHLSDRVIDLVGQEFVHPYAPSYALESYEPGAMDQKERFPIGTVLFAKGRAYRVDYQRSNLCAHSVVLQCPSADGNCGAAADLHALVFGPKEIIATTLADAMEMEIVGRDEESDPIAGLGLQPYAVAVDTDCSNPCHLFVADKVDSKTVIVRKLRLDDGSPDLGYIPARLKFYSDNKDDWNVYLRVSKDRVLCEIRSQYIDTYICHLFLLNADSGRRVYYRLCQCPEDMHFALSRDELLLYKIYDGGYCERSNICFVIRRVLLIDLEGANPDICGSDDGFFLLTGLDDRCRRTDSMVWYHYRADSCEVRWRYAKNVSYVNKWRRSVCDVCTEYNSAAIEARNDYTAWTHCDCQQSQQYCGCANNLALSSCELAREIRLRQKRKRQKQKCGRCWCEVRKNAVVAKRCDYLCRICRLLPPALPHHGNSPFPSLYPLNGDLFVVATNRQDALRVIDAKKGACRVVAKGCCEWAKCARNVSGCRQHGLHIANVNQWCNAFEYENHTVVISKSWTNSFLRPTFALAPKIAKPLSSWR